MKKLTAFFMALALILTEIPISADAKAKVALNRTNLTLQVGENYQLKLKNAGTKAKIYWVSSKKKIASVSQKGKVTAKKAGTAKITAKLSITDGTVKKYVCTVKVKSAKTPAATKAPSVTKTPAVPATSPTPMVPTPNVTTEPTVTVPPAIGKVMESGSYGKTSWKIYENGLLEVKGTGNMNSEEELPEWLGYSEDIKSARIEVTGATRLDGLFFWCPELVCVDVSKLDTSKVTNMEEMFYRCYNLKSLDLSTFDISKVTNVDRMFSACVSLTTICTPKKSAEKVPELPSSVWKEGNGKIYEKFPVNATKSITLLVAKASGWQKVYIDYFKEYIKNRGAEIFYGGYNFVDIDENGVPEIVIGEGTQESVLYWIEDSKVCRSSDPLGADVWWNSKTKEFVSISGNGMDWQSMIIQKFDFTSGLKTTKTASWGKHAEPNYTIDGEECTKEEYENLLESKTKECTIFIGENVENIIKGIEKYDQSTTSGSSVGDTEGDVGEVSSTKWKQAYIDYFSQSDNCEFAKYSIKDINGDGIPEIFTDRQMLYGISMIYLDKQNRVNQINSVNGYVKSGDYVISSTGMGTIREYIYRYNSDNRVYDKLHEGVYIIPGPNEEETYDIDGIFYNSYKEYSSAFRALYDNEELENILCNNDVNTILQTISDY